jgi:hypothetical protein
MVAALLGEAQPAELEGDCLLLDFPADAEFSKKKAMSNARLIERSIRALTGAAVRLDCRANGERATQPALLSEEELLARLKAEFDAREVLEEPHDAAGDDPQPPDPT